jgi:small conductance mechanosensitive channel
VEVWGLDRFDPNWMVVKGQIKTRPLQQWSVARAFNARLKRHMDEAGIEMPVPQMQVHMSSRGGDVEEPHGAAHGHPHPHGVHVGGGVARDASHEPRPAPPPTAGPEGAPPQIPTAGSRG